MMRGGGLIKHNRIKPKTSVHCHKSSAEQQEAVNLGRGERGSQSPSHTAPFWFSTELFNCVSRVSISQVQFQGHAWLLSLVFWSCLPVKTHNWDRERLFLIHAPHLKNKKSKENIMMTDTLIMTFYTSAPTSFYFVIIILNKNLYRVGEKTFYFAKSETHLNYSASWKSTNRAIYSKVLKYPKHHVLGPSVKSRFCH